MVYVLVERLVDVPVKKLLAHQREHLPLVPPIKVFVFDRGVLRVLGPYLQEVDANAVHLEHHKDEREPVSGLES